MKAYKKLCILTMTLGFAGSLFSADAAGGYSPVRVSNKDVIAAAEFAVTAQEKAMNGLKDSTPSKLTLVELLSAQQQVVAGMNFRMKLKVKVGGVEKQAEAVVWWQASRKQDPYRLTRWTWDKGAAMMSAPPKDWMKWAEWIDKLHPVDDGKGHGPDIGSGEWARALAHQLGVADKGGHGPNLGSHEWRRGVERKLLTRRAEQGGAEQPATALEPKAEGKEKTKP